MARRVDAPLPSTMGDCEALAFESPEDAPAEDSEEPAEDAPPAHPARSREDTRPSELSDVKNDFRVLDIHRDYHT